MSKIYPVFGALVLGWLGYAVWFGFALGSVDEVRDVPKTVRDNPGVYRAHYRSYHTRVYRGK